AFVDAAGAADDDRRGHIVHGNAECVGLVDVHAVFILQIHGDRVIAGAVGVCVRVVACGRVRVARAVAPVDDVSRDRVSAWIGRRAQRHCVAAAFFDEVGAADGDGGGHIVHGNAERVGLVGVIAIFVLDFNGDSVIAGAVGVCVGVVACGGVGAARAVAPMD